MRAFLNTILSLLGVSLALCSSLGGGGVRASDGRPNFVIVFADDFGFDVECFGSPTTRTPFINQMAQEGMKMNQWNTAHSICSPSRAALLTGRYAIRTGIFGNETHHAPNTGDHRVVHPNCYGGLPADEITIAENLKSANYTSMAIGKWHLGYSYGKPDHLPTRHGFDKFYGTPYTHCEGPPSYPAVPVFDDETKVGRIGIDIVREDLVWRYADKAVEFIANNSARPFFLYVAMDNTHSPVFAPSNFTSRRGPYGAATEALDWVVGQVMGALKEHQIDKNTLVVFTSDNGAWYIPGPTEAGVVGPFQGTYAPKTFGYVDTGKGSTWEGGFRVPAVMWWPGTIPSASICENFVSSLDLFVTFSSLAGVTPSPDKMLDGKDISPLLSSGCPALNPHGNDASENYTFFYYRGPKFMAARSGAYKVHYVTHSGFGSDPFVYHDPPLLFDVEVDPQERQPLQVSRYEAIVQQITSSVTAHNKTVIPVTPQLDLIDIKAMDCQGLTEKQSQCCAKLGGHCTY